MAQRSHVPKFGNWEGEEKAAYTVYFDKARKGRTGGKIINPNDPEQNPEILSYLPASAQVTPPVQAPPPSRELRATYENGHAAPARSRPRDNDNTDSSAAVPKFGEWNEANPKSADGYTHIFNKVREVRLGGTRAASVPAYSPHPDTSKHSLDNDSTCCCFSWGSK